MKRILTSVLVMVLLLISTVGVCAEGSRENTITPGGDSIGYYEFSDSDTQAPEVNGKSRITNSFDIKAINGGKVVNGKHQVTINVPSLTSGMSELTIGILGADGNWTYTTASNVDYANKNITFQLTDIGTAAIYAAVASNGAQGTSPATADVSTWMLLMGAALVLCGCGSVMVKKSLK